MEETRASVINHLLRDVCNALTTEDMIRIEKKIVPGGKVEKYLQIGTEVIKSEEIESLASEARTLGKLRAWNKVVEHMRSVATDRLVNSSKTIDDMVFAKAMLYTLQELKKVIKELADL